MARSFRELGYQAYCFLYRTIRGESAYRRWLFSRIYSGNRWGADGQGGFFSGIGSRGEVAARYVDAMTSVLAAYRDELGRPLTIVDLGCGDFAIGQALLKALPDAIYVGCDIVPELVAHNNATHGSARVSFRVLDIVADPLPAGDVCLVRQVLQHLPNAEIARFLQSADYARLFVTEGQPVRPSGVVNPDKPAGQTVRFDWGTGEGSGVELSKPPFNMVTTELFRTTIPGHEVIVTQEVHAGRTGA